MGYTADQYEVDFTLLPGKEEEARKAALAAEIGFSEDDTLEDMFLEAGWDWQRHDGESDSLHRTEGKILNSTEELLRAIAPFVKDESYVVMVGEDMVIWRWYFHSGELDMQDGEITFPKPMSPAEPNRKVAPAPIENLAPPGLEEGECFVDTVKGQKLVFPSYESEPEGCSYVRFIDEAGAEIAHWTSDEWLEDPKLVMGAIMACIQKGVLTR